MHDLDGFLSDTITIQPYVSRDAYGDVTYGAAVSYSARVENRIKKVRNRQGEEVISTAGIFLDGAVTVTYADKITLPDGSIPVILAIEEGKDDQGTICYVEVDT